MKKIIFALLIFMSSLLSSCVVSGQSIYGDYQKIYFDYVISGRVDSPYYVYDGTYSYHILGTIPKNVYWELYPCGYDVYLYTKQMVRMRLFEWTRRQIYYNRSYPTYYRFDYRHRPPSVRYHGTPSHTIGGGAYYRNHYPNHYNGGGRTGAGHNHYTPRSGGAQIGGGRTGGSNHYAPRSGGASRGGGRR